VIKGGFGDETEERRLERVWPGIIVLHGQHLDVVQPIQDRYQMQIVDLVCRVAEIYPELAL
jgi:hypothetical protein